MIKPQSGFQEKALSTPADIAILGGAAGAGKTFTITIEPLRHINNPNFNCVIFRRVGKQIKTAGGLWDEAQKIYPNLKGVSNLTDLKYTFPSGAYISFKGLPHEKDVEQYQGSQIPLIIFDEVTHFTEKQFIYMLSRNRSTSGIKPYIRATCNPDPESFVAKLIDWYIGDDGYPIEERCGVLRYFIRDGEDMIWGNSVEEVANLVPHIIKDQDPNNLIKSFTFIPGKIYDNKVLLEKDPAYLANLHAMTPEEKARLLDGNWKIKIDNLSLCGFDTVSDIFTNVLSNENKEKRITIDHARQGRDLCVIITWIGYHIDRITILTKSDSNQIVGVINQEKARLGGIGSSNIIIDNDGYGVVDQIKCKTFIPNSTPKKRKVNGQDIPQNYKTLKDQVSYIFCQEFVNTHKISMNNDEIFVNGVKTRYVTIENKRHDVHDLITRQLLSIRRIPQDKDEKKAIIPKNQQKLLLQGMSPDLSDAMVMLMDFELGGSSGIKLGFI